MRKLFVSSETRQSGESTSNFVVSVNSSNLYVSKFRLNTCSIPFSWYPVNSNNNKIYFSESAGGGTRIAVLTPGNYTFASLAAEVKTKMEAATANAVVYTVTYDSEQNQFIIGASTGTVSFLFGSNIESSAYKLLGSDSTDTTTASSYTFPNFPQINTPSQIYIRSNTLAGILKNQNMINGRSSGNCVEVINVNADQGYWIYWESPSDVFYEVSGSLPQNIDIQLTDYAGNAIDLRGADCNFEFLFA